MSLKTRFLISLWGLLVLISGAYSYLLFETERSAYMDGVDRVLWTSVSMAQNILPENFHDGLVDETSISNEDYLKIIDRWNRICRENDLQYLWSNMIVDGDFVFTTSTSTSKDINNGDHALFFDVHSDPGSYDEVRASEQPTYTSFSNEWGKGRMLLVPGRDAHGRFFVFGASLATDVLDEMIREAMIKALTVFLIMLTVGSVLGYVLGNRITRSLAKLAQVASDIAHGQYDARSEKIDGDYEIASLAESIDVMGEAIQNQNTHLEEQVVERTEELTKKIAELDFQKYALDEHAIVSITDVDGNITYANRKFCDISGYTQEEVLGKNHRLLNSGFHPPEFFADLWHTISSGNVWTGSIKNRKKNGGVYWVYATIVPFLNLRGEPFQYVAIRTDITARIKAEEEAQKANLAKSEFLATMSHEIRTPMNGVIGTAGLLLDTKLDEEQRKLTETIHQSGDALLSIISEILDISKLEAGKLELEKVDFDLRKLINGVTEIFKPQATDKGVDIEFLLPDDLAGTYRSDAGRLRQVLMNLVGNAIKFTNEGTVTVNLCPPEGAVQEASLRFEVTDTGIGIPEASFPRLFDSFTQVDASTTRKFGGTGLGLAICKKLIEAMGGQIGVISEEGQGSTFWFELSIERVNSERTKNPGTETNEVVAGGSRVLTILVAEDNQVNQMVAKGVLEKFGHKVELVGNGQEALEAVLSKKYDLVFMDMQMPEVDGLAATRAIRGQPSDVSQIPIVAMTANAMKSDEERCLEAGMNGFITKPLNKETILNLLSEMFPAD